MVCVCATQSNARLYQTLPTVFVAPGRPACAADALDMNPRAFFVSGEPHHCAHSVVADAKFSVITDANAPVCGPRSGSRGQAFCELFRFETRLCCRTCAFESVCTKTRALAIVPLHPPAT